MTALQDSGWLLLCNDTGDLPETIYTCETLRVGVE